MARQIALRMAHAYPTRLPREDLDAASMLGLIEAAQAYDESQKAPFASFAERRIRSAVLDEIRRGNDLAQPVAIANLNDGSTAIDDQTAAESGDVTRAEHDGSTAEVHVHLAAVAAGGLADECPSPEAEADKQRSMKFVYAALSQLEARDVKVLGLHYLHELTYDQIGSVIGVARTRAFQVLWRAVDRLRSQVDLAMSRGGQRSNR